MIHYYMKFREFIRTIIRVKIDGILIDSVFGSLAGTFCPQFRHCVFKSAGYSHVMSQNKLDWQY